ncbi:Hypothetical protein LUCI_5058 [Lucifera butyrica]|uniref:Dynamin N-terminal domain-containing protein n=1 Tax=Lucifera butyrica TaxID=1351585 RepID=A0A498RG25_9FIRM|nr:dynamin family protein [Lucifera butyrica]VBB09760.1 Hypothetical protein LUCI_5058 [Lucifera butyrica]
METSHKQNQTGTDMVQALAELAGILRNLRVPAPLLRGIMEQINRLGRDTFNLAVLGQYKRGKTTLVNALLGQEVLPSAVVPLTSIITVLGYGEVPAGRAIYIDGREEEIDLGNLSPYITEAGNPGNEKQIKQVEIMVPSPLLQQGIQLIDTPGIGSVYQNNSDTTHEFLSQVDAGIFILSVEPPISQEECRFLQTIRQHVRKMFFVFNKMDLADEAERKQSIEFSRTIIERETGFEVETVYLLSAKQALMGTIHQDERLITASRFPEFQQALATFVRTERQRTLLDAAAFRAKQAVREAVLKVDLENSVLDMPVKEVTSQLAALQEHFVAIQREKLDLAYLLKGELERFNDRLLMEMKDFESATTQTTRQQLQKFWQERNNRELKQLLPETRQVLSRLILQQFDQVRQSQEQKVEAWLAATISRFEQKNNALLQQIKELAASLFAVPCQTIASHTTLSPKSSLYFLPQIPNTLLFSLGDWKYRFLPRSLAGKIFLNSCLDEIHELVSMNCGRLRYDLSSRAADSIRTFKRELDNCLEEAMQDVLATIQAGMEIKNQGEERILERRRELAGLRTRLTGLEPQF